MIKLSLIIVAISCLSSLICAPLHAQGSSRTSSNTSKLRIGCTDIVDGLHSFHLRQVGRNGKPSESLEINLNIYNTSKPIEARAGNKLLFYKTAAEAENEDETVKPIATCTLPATGEYILLFIPNKNKKLPVAYNVLAIPTDKAPYGSFFIMNYTPYPVYAKIGTKKAKIPTKKHYNFLFRGGINDAPVSLFIEPKKGQHQAIRNSQWSIAPETREFIIIYSDSSNGATLFKHIVDHQEEERRQP